MGSARTGKDTLANHLAEKYGCIRLGLADPMKRFCAEIFGFSDDQLYGDKRDDPDLRFPRGNPPTTYLSPRYALQRLGTEWGRDCYENVWVDYGMQMAKLLLDGRHTYTVKHGPIQKPMPMARCPGVVFSDLRFKNEFDAVKKAGGVMVRLYREGYGGQVGIEGHQSEAEQRTLPDDLFDVVINNPPGLENYYAVIEDVFDEALRGT